MSQHHTQVDERLDIKQYTAWLDITIGVNCFLFIIMSKILCLNTSPLSQETQCRMICALAFCFTQAVLVVIGVFLLVAVRANIKLFLDDRA